MVKVFKITVLIFLILSSGLVSAQKKNMGMIKISKSESSFNRGLDIDSFKLWSYNIWVKDSAVIYEVRTHFQSVESIKDSDIIKESYPVFKYVFLDLKTMKAQDYTNLSDTALPVNYYSFIVNPGEGSYLRPFYDKPIPQDTLGMSILKDTLMHGLKYKRIRVDGENPTSHLKYKLIYYLEPKIPQTIYHINPSLDKLFKNHLVTRVDFYSNKNEPVSTFNYKILKLGLDVTQTGIFNIWQKNSVETKLPLQTLKDVEKSPTGMLIHENPTIMVVPKRKG